MAVNLITLEQKWIGLSTDQKPMNAQIGAKFTETNTGKKFIWDGSNWVEDLTMIWAINTALREGGRL